MGGGKEKESEGLFWYCLLYGRYDTAWSRPPLYCTLPQYLEQTRCVALFEGATIATLTRNSPISMEGPIHSLSYQ